MKIIRIEIECALPPDYTGVWWKNNLESDIEERTGIPRDCIEIDVIKDDEDEDERQ